MKEDPVRQVGETVLALVCLAACGVTLVFVSLPILIWLLDLVRPTGWLEGVVGAIVGLLIFGLSIMPTMIVYDFLNNWYVKLTSNDDE